MKQWIAVVPALLLPNGQPAASIAANTRSSADELSAYIAPLLDLQVFSGTILVAHGNRVVLSNSYGFADVEHGIRLKSTDVFRIASISKSFTKVLIGRFADQGKLSLDDTLSRWLPRIPSASRITIRMLLDHRSGIPHMNSLPHDEESIEQNSLATLVDAIARRPLDFEPGSRRRYSNGGYAVLARVAELVGGGSFDDILRREVIQPLHLDHTRHEVDGTLVRDRAVGYMPSPDEPRTLVHAPFQEMSTKLGGGSLMSNAADLLHWARAIGNSTLIQPSTWAELFPVKDTLLAMEGRCPGYNAYVLRDRVRDITVVVLANNYSAGMVSDIAGAAMAIVRDQKPKPLPIFREVAGDIAMMSRLAGEYAMPPGALGLPPGSRIDLRVVAGHLVAYLHDTPVDVLIPQPSGSYLARSLWSVIDVPHGDRPSSLHIRALYNDSGFDVERVGP